MDCLKTVVLPTELVWRHHSSGIAQSACKSARAYALRCRRQGAVYDDGEGSDVEDINDAMDSTNPLGELHTTGSMTTKDAALLLRAVLSHSSDDGETFDSDDEDDDDDDHDDDVDDGITTATASRLCLHHNGMRGDARDAHCMPRHASGRASTVVFNACVVRCDGDSEDRMHNDRGNDCAIAARAESTRATRERYQDRDTHLVSEGRAAIIPLDCGGNSRGWHEPW